MNQALPVLSIRSSGHVDVDAAILRPIQEIAQEILNNYFFADQLFSFCSLCASIEPL